MNQGHSSWEYYSGVYGGPLDKSAYESRAIRAAQEICARTLGKSGAALAREADALCAAECELIDVLYDADMAPKAGAVAVNNDGYAVRYGARGGIDAAVSAILQRWLPQRLLWRGV